MPTREISDTAYLIAWGRSKFPEISLDKYAHLFLTKKGIRFGKEFAENVSQLAPYLFSLRSWYIVNQLKAFEKKHNNSTLINVGSGLTSYPFILSAKTKVINIDQIGIIEAYNELVSDLMKKELLPKRQIISKIIDLNTDNGVEEVSKILSEESKPSFLLLEGILTYLDFNRAKRLVKACSEKLVKGSKIIIHVFLKDYFKSKSWNCAHKFINSKFAFSTEDLSAFSVEDFTSIRNLKLIEHVGFREIQERIKRSDTISDDELLDERFLLFERT